MQNKRKPHRTWRSCLAGMKGPHHSPMWNRGSAGEWSKKALTNQAMNGCEGFCGQRCNADADEGVGAPPLLSVQVSNKLLPHSREARSVERKFKFRISEQVQRAECMHAFGASAIVFCHRSSRALVLLA